MTKEEAIHFAECLKNNWTINFADMEEFCDMAIEALSEETSTIQEKHQLLEETSTNTSTKSTNTSTIAKSLIHGSSQQGFAV